MKRKKILIVTIIVLILIIVTSVIIYAKFNNSKNEDFLSSSNEITQDENLNQNMNELDTNLNEINNNIQENLVDNGISDNDKVISEEQDKKETRTKEDTSTQPKSTEEKQITTQKKNESSGQKTTKNQSSVTTQKQQESRKVETNPAPIETKKEHTTTTPKAETSKEQATTCSNGHHLIGNSNTGKWFNTKQEAIDYYHTTYTYWSNKWKNDEIDDDTFHKKCPNRYETFQCACGKWTVDFFYEY